VSLSLSLSLAGAVSGMRAGRGRGFTVRRRVKGRGRRSGYWHKSAEHKGITVARTWKLRREKNKRKRGHRGREENDGGRWAIAQS